MKRQGGEQLPENPIRGEQFMWNRLQHVSWICALFILLGCGTGVAYAAPLPASIQHPQSLSASVASGGDFSKFAGRWVAHGAFMIISRDGEARFGARTYSWCGPQVAQPCDSLVQDQIRDGYNEQLMLSRAEDATAYGMVIFSNDPTEQLNTAITLTLGPNNTLIYTNNGSITLLCGPAAPAGTCGA
jgi:hypothetical protein